MIYQNQNFLQTLARQPCDRIPIWLMRQAGRYLPEYQKTRARAGDFMTLCKTPELACEVTLQPITRFGFDAAIIFSDILTIPDAMGLEVQFLEGQGPVFTRTLKHPNDIAALPIPDPEQALGFVMEAIRLTCRALHGSIPLIGFSGSPWTLAAYMLEGGSSREFKQAKLWLYDQPKSLHLLLTKLTEAISLYLKAQIKAGVACIQIFDTWGGLLSHDAYQHFSLAYLTRIVQSLKNDPATTATPIIVFTKNGGIWFEQILSTGADAIGLDWTMDLRLAHHLARNRVALQGNLDPHVLYAKPEQIAKEVTRILHSLPDHTGYIFNLGHGILPDISIDHVHAMLNAVRQFKPIRKTT